MNKSVISEDTVKNEILQGLLQVDNTFTISDFSMDFDSSTRNLVVKFTAQNSSGNEVKGVSEYA